MGMDRKARAVIAGAITSPGFLRCGGRAAAGRAFG